MLRSIKIVVGALILNGCALFTGPNIDIDKDNSGRLEGQSTRVFMTSRVDPSGAEFQAPEIKQANDKFWSNFPTEIRIKCRAADSDDLPDSSVGAVFASAAIPFLIAGFEVGYDYFVESVDKKLARLKKAAVKSYEGNFQTRYMYAFPEQCVILVRLIDDEAKDVELAPDVQIEKRIASLFVFQIEELVTEVKELPEKFDGPSEVNSDTGGHITHRAHKISPIFARVDFAAAQTAKGKGEEKANIKPTVAVSLSAYEYNEKLERDELRELLTHSFSFGALDLKQSYCAPDLASGCGKPLKADPSPLYIPIRESQTPTIGMLKMSVVERGTAADLDDLSAADQAARKAVKGTLSGALKDILK